MIPHHILDKAEGSSPSAKFGMILSPGRRWGMFACALVLCWVIGNVINGILLSKFGMTTRSLRIAAVIQSVIVIILPAVMTAVMVSRRPGTFLGIETKPHITPIFLAVCALVCATPTMNCIIKFNESLSLPETFSVVEQWMRSAEQSAASTIAMLQGGGTVVDLIMSILIVGILAGVGEELLFRGTLQRLMLTSGSSPHVAVWVSAAVFSAIHMQFFGFIPRMILGAFFGYLLYWSGSLWLPIIVHASNNIIYVVAKWTSIHNGEAEVTIDTVGTSDFSSAWPIITLSVVMTALVLAAIYRATHSHPQVINQKPDQP